MNEGHGQKPETTSAELAKLIDAAREGPTPRRLDHIEAGLDRKLGGAPALPGNPGVWPWLAGLGLGLAALVALLLVVRPDERAAVRPPPAPADPPSRQDPPAHP
ncbi:MAG TPA: hypothetical protein RMH99_16965, partial [Sandaracinaceae bacterium LLY-WYZ-13_1]|nr:hypothetical protein [Sandaracinaceae bacterium LLY-WYZ-13_1]